MPPWVCKRKSPLINATPPGDLIVINEASHGRRMRSRRASIPFARPGAHRRVKIPREFRSAPRPVHEQCPVTLERCQAWGCFRLVQSSPWEPCGGMTIGRCMTTPSIIHHPSVPTFNRRMGVLWWLTAHARLGLSSDTRESRWPECHGIRENIPRSFNPTKCTGLAIMHDI